MSADKSPLPAEVRAAREKARLTQTEAAALVHGTLRAWQGWEAPTDEPLDMLMVCNRCNARFHRD